jgi:hypothetical protein
LPPQAMATLALANSISLDACIPDEWDEPPHARGRASASGGGAAAVPALTRCSEGGAVGGASASAAATGLLHRFERMLHLGGGHAAAVPAHHGAGMV